MSTLNITVIKSQPVTHTNKHVRTFLAIILKWSIKLDKHH